MIESFDRNELIMEGLAYTVMGVAIVFMILVIIMLVIKAMALFSVEKTHKVQSSATAETPAPVTVQEKKQDDSELIAVITAAVAAAMGRSTSGLVVRSYKNVSGDAWNRAGRLDVLENRL